MNPYLNPYLNPNLMFQPKFDMPDIIFVQGIEGAKAFQLKEGRKAVLFDSENTDRFYIKTCDDAGMCSLKFFEYKEIPSPLSTSNLSEYVRKDELEQLLTLILGGNVDESKVSNTTKRQKSDANGKNVQTSRKDD